MVQPADPFHDHALPYPTHLLLHALNPFLCTASVWYLLLHLNHAHALVVLSWAMLNSSDVLPLAWIPLLCKRGAVCCCLLFRLASTLHHCLKRSTWVTPEGRLRAAD